MVVNSLFIAQLIVHQSQWNVRIFLTMISPDVSEIGTQC
jgi:hypothetical protein